MQVRVPDANGYYSCDDSALSAQDVIENDQLHLTRKQSLQTNDTENVAYRTNSEGIEPIIFICAFHILHVEFKLCVLTSIPILSLYSKSTLIIFYFSGALVRNLLSVMKEKLAKINFLYVPQALASFIERLVEFIFSLRFEFWRTPSIVHPSNSTEHYINNHSEAIEATSERECILPCEHRLQRLERVFDELNNKPDGMPLEKEKMLMDSLDRIKSVEFDLEKTKRVFIYAFINRLFLLIIVFKFSEFSAGITCRSDEAT